MNNSAEAIVVASYEPSERTTISEEDSQGNEGLNIASFLYIPEV
jgi:hypothetical protein